MPWYPKVIASIVVAQTLVLLFVRPFREWAFGVEVRKLIGFHLVRFVGIYFLYLYSNRELPYDFAVFGGIGDILVATLAMVLIFFANSKPAVVGWNAFGLIDILAVAITAARSELAVPGSMYQFDKLPLILLPTFVVPVIIATHGLMLVRAFRDTKP
jgi:hypothetical protein